MNYYCPSLSCPISALTTATVSELLTLLLLLPSHYNLFIEQPAIFKNYEPDHVTKTFNGFSPQTYNKTQALILIYQGLCGLAPACVSHFMS